ncbi:hypothetical protein H2199_008928 [Coniosporium tulheliwenetii]|uniref:Uncharacterized protein n=1 Tax=Coniosporium tulheliwenetii TaxID=3383036 RepID=A0ACC2YH86_9PEZI|nr:hypothetical protein H2199_008928 [Cladosporium sp. JES 115]
MRWALNRRVRYIIPTDFSASRFDADGKRQPPNSWAAAWGGSAWEHDEPSDEYYLHIFAPEQPDLNWKERPPIRETDILSIITTLAVARCPVRVRS